MNTMPREIARRQPAPLVPRTPARVVPDRHIETLVGSPNALNKELARMKAAGELIDVGQRRVIPSGRHAGLIELRVQRRDVAPPRWTRRAIAIGAGFGMFAGVLAAFLWLLTSLSTAALTGFCFMVLAGLVALARAGRTPARTSGVTATAIAVASVTVK